MNRIFLLLLALMSGVIAEAQSTFVYYLDAVTPTLTTNGTTVPYNVNVATVGKNVVYRAEDEVLFQRDVNNATSEVLITSTNAALYFHAYLTPPVAFAELKKELDGSLYGTIDNRLYFRFEEKYNKGGALTFKVYNYLKQEAAVPLQYCNLPLSANNSLLLGTNYLALNFSNVGTNEKVYATNDTDSIYILEVTDSKGEKSYARFKLIKIR